MTDRVRGFVNVLSDGRPSIFIDGTIEESRTMNPHHRSILRTAEVVELREGETVVTREMREKIEQFTGSLWTAETRRAVKEILLILDGKDGQ